MPTRLVTDDLAAAIEQALEPMLTRMTEAVAELRGNSLNNVLRVETVIIGGTGTTNRVHKRTSVPFASIGVWAYQHEITVVAGVPQADYVPTAGIGVVYIPAGGSGVFPLTGEDITIYGTNGDRVLLAAWSAPQPPSFGDGPVIGGTP